MRSERQLRRAEARRLRKQERKAPAESTTGTPLSPVDLLPDPKALLDEEGDMLLASLESHIAKELYPSVSDKQLAANQRNAQASTGTRTAKGKARSSRNALRHGLTSQTIVLAPEDADRYSAMCERFRSGWNPVGERELELTQMLIDTQWRLNRVPRLEAALYATGRIEFCDMFSDAEPELQASLIDIHTLTAYERQFRNLHIQESRLRRNYAVISAELQLTQQNRRAEDNKRAHAAKLAAQAEEAQKQNAPANGFVFANPPAGNDPNHVPPSAAPQNDDRRPVSPGLSGQKR
jgi:hypothetical protein